MPELSIVVCVKECARQAQNSLFSLSAQFQQNVSVSDYEVLVVETASPDELGEAAALAHGENFRYLRCDLANDWRARSLELGAGESRAPYLGFLLDGAQIISQRAIEHALLARRGVERSLVFVPSYRIEEGALEAVDWRANAYDLFAKASFGPANFNGFLGPMLGATCLFVSADRFRVVGGAPKGIERPGGGPLSLALFTNLNKLAGTQLIALAGEGAFRQPHPDVAGLGALESDLHALIFDRVSMLVNFSAVHREPIAFGPIPGSAQRFLSESARLADFHCAIASKHGEPWWYED